MSDKNIISLTKIRMTPKTMKAFCAVSAAFILILLVVCAFVVPESSHSHGGHASTNATDMTDDSEDVDESVDETAVMIIQDGTAEAPIIDWGSVGNASEAGADRAQ